MSKAEHENSGNGKQAQKNNDVKQKYNKSYLILLITILVVGITCIMVVPSLSKGKAYETVAVEHFLNEQVSLHNGEYQVTVNYAKSVNGISYLKSAKDKNKVCKTGNYLEIELDIVKIKRQAEKSHILKPSDFALKSNAKIKLPFYGSYRLYGIDDTEIEPDENNCITNTDVLKERSAICDYAWVNKEIRYKEKVRITLNFLIGEVTDKRAVYILTIDFLEGHYDNKKGTEIALLNIIIKPDLYC